MAELPTRQLGRTGLQVTTLGYGAMELRGASEEAETTTFPRAPLSMTTTGAPVNAGSRRRAATTGQSGHHSAQVRRGPFTTSRASSAATSTRGRCARSAVATSKISACSE